MSGLEIVALVVTSAWLAILTLVVMLLVRQIGLITVRLELTGGHIPMDDDGIGVGEQVSERTLNALPQLSAGTTYVLIFSASCVPCREFAAELDGTRLDADTVALLSGPEELAHDLVKPLAGIAVVRDPEATEIANELRITTAPFVFEITDAYVTAKKYIRSATDVEKLINKRREPIVAVTNGTGSH